MKKQPTKLDFIIAIIVNLALLYIFNHLLIWNVKFITPKFAIPLVVSNISMALTIFFNMVFLVFYRPWLKALTQAPLNLLGAIFIYELYAIYPFNFYFLKIDITNPLKLAFLICSIILAALSAVEFIRFIVLVFKNYQDTAS